MVLNTHLFLKAFSGVERLQFIVPVEKVDHLDPVSDTMEVMRLSKANEKIVPESPDRSVCTTLKMTQKDNGKFESDTSNSSGFGYMSGRAFDRSERKQKSDKSSYGQNSTYQDKVLADSMPFTVGGFNLEPQVEVKPALRLRVPSGSKSSSLEDLLSRNIEFLLGESSHPSLLDELKEERETTKLALSKTILNINGSFAGGSMLSTGASNATPFASFEGSKDFQRLQKSLSDLQRDGKPRNSYCNPCRLI